VTFQTISIKPLIGTRIDADKATLLDGSRAQNLRELLETRGVLTFPTINLNDEEQRTFAATLGTPTDQGERGLHKISLDENVTAVAKYLKGTVLWHFDGWNDPIPARGTVLTGRVLSQTGGETEFSNTYAAYEELPEGMKARLVGLKVAHTMMSTQNGAHEVVTSEMEADWASFPIYRHEWQVGDMIVWDNCGVLHRVTPYPADSGRVLHRVTLEGEEAIA
jgi:alpha-ketoglutarate-dependent taurine dioxygenase